MRITSSKSKNAESFYITRSFIDENGHNTTKTVRKLGTLKQLMEELKTDRDGVIAWCKQQAELETQKEKEDREESQILVPLQLNKPIEKDMQRVFSVGYLPIQKLYSQMRFNNIFRNIVRRYDYEYDLESIFSDLVYARILEPGSKRFSYAFAQSFLEQPKYHLYDVYRALDVLDAEMDYIQSEIYKNSNFVYARNNKVVYYDCTNFYFEIEEEDDFRKYGKEKNNRPAPIVQMGLFMDRDGIPMQFSIFEGNENEQKSLIRNEQKILNQFGAEKFVICTDSGLASVTNKRFNDRDDRAFIVTQSIKKLKKEEKEWALQKTGFRRVGDGAKVSDISLIQDTEGLYYKEFPLEQGGLEQRLIVTYSPKYAQYQKKLRQAQIERAKKMIETNSVKRISKKETDPKRFIKRMDITEEGELAQKTTYFLNQERITDEERYDGFYALTTDLLDDDIESILKVSEGRWEIEESFMIMKDEFRSRPVNVRLPGHIRAHFLTCYTALLLFRILEKKLQEAYTAEALIHTLREMKVTRISGEVYVPSYTRTEITDAIHDVCGFRTDYQAMRPAKLRHAVMLSKLR